MSKSSRSMRFEFLINANEPAIYPSSPQDIRQEHSEQDWVLWDEVNAAQDLINVIRFRRIPNKCEKFTLVSRSVRFPLWMSFDLIKFSQQQTHLSCRDQTFIQLLFVPALLMMGRGRWLNTSFFLITPRTWYSTRLFVRFSMLTVLSRIDIEMFGWLSPIIESSGSGSCELSFSTFSITANGFSSRTSLPNMMWWPMMRI